MGIAHDLRIRLADLLAEAGPDAPTLCEGWTTRRLAGHLVSRERRPDAALGVLLPPFAGWREHVEARTAQSSYDGLVGAVRKGSLLTPMSLPPLNNAVNAVEFAVHGEDVARGSGEAFGKRITAAQQVELGGRLGLLVRVVARRVPAPFELRDPDGALLARHGSGVQPAVVHGEPLELLLWVTGRTGAAQVTVTGPPDRVRALAEAKLGL